MSGGGGIEVVALRDDQEDACAALLARAFFDDPIFSWVEPEAEARRRLLAALFVGLTRRSHRLAVALTTAPAMLGASLWKGPDLRELSPAQLAMTGLDRLGEHLTPEATARFDAVFGPVDASLAEDVKVPVWYLGVLGVAPGHQGRGIGTELMRPILERADRERRAVTLETAKAQNLPLYLRNGFEVMRELPPPVPGGPVVWTMKREPR